MSKLYELTSHFFVCFSKCHLKPFEIGMNEIKLLFSENKLVDNNGETLKM